MSTLSDQSPERSWLYALLDEVVRRAGSDLFLIPNAAPALKVNGHMLRLGEKALTGANTQAIAQSIMTPLQLSHFLQTKESNFAIAPPTGQRFRVNAFMRLGEMAMVLRVVALHPPTIDGLGLPSVVKTIALHKRGLVIMVGATGAGKSSALAAMVDWINENTQGHIVTVEDPIEFLHPHKQCIVTQREIGIDTLDWSTALKNALRQAPDVIMVGELRDREATEQAVTFSETGHLVLATLHANNTNQALERLVGFFPDTRRSALYLDLSMNLRAVICQRLVRRADDTGRVPAVEIMLNTPLIGDLMRKGDIPGMRLAMEHNPSAGMQTFQQSLFDLFEAGTINLDDALRNADSLNDLRLHIKLHSKRQGIKDLSAGTEHLGIL